MKKKIAFGLFMFLAFSSVSYAAVKSTFIRLPEGATAYVYGDAIDKEHMNVIKFVDGKVTCYSVITKVGVNAVNTSISCVK